MSTVLLTGWQQILRPAAWFSCTHPQRGFLRTCSDEACVSAYTWLQVKKKCLSILFEKIDFKTNIFSLLAK